MGFCKRWVSFAVFILSLVFCGVSAEAKLKDTTWLGDSRFVGMDAVVNENFKAKVSMGYNWGVKQKIDTGTVIIGLGVNDLGNIGKYKSWVKKLAKDHTVYYLSVNPVNESKCKTVTNKAIKKFNKEIKGVSGIKYLDTFSWLQGEGFKSNDGLHYDSATYKKLHKKIVKMVKADGGGSSDSSSSSGIGDSSSSSGTKKGKFDSGNDGKERDAKDCYCDSGLVSSFKGVKYYDAAVPYKLTCGEIGGIDPGYENKIGENHISAEVMRETSMEYAQGNYPTLWKESVTDAGGKWGYDDGFMAYVEDKKGTKWYMTAVQPYFFAVNSWKDADFKCKPGFGSLFDCILTDGTCIHFILADVNATEHTNGATAKTKKKQYDHIFAYQNSNCLEIWTKYGVDGTVKFKKKFGFDKGVRIAYYRMYNKNIQNPPTVAFPEAKAPYWKMTESGVPIAGTFSGQAGKTEGQKINEKNGAVAVKAAFSEEQLGAWMKLKEESLEADLQAANRSNLSGDELESLEEWRVNASQNRGFEGFARKVVLFFGIAMIVWAIFLYIGYWFDRINTFFDINVVGILTLGKLRISDTELEATWGIRKEGDASGIRTVNHRSILTICIISITFSVFIISGTVFKAVSFIIHLVKGI